MNRKGFSLLETMVAVSASFILILMAIGLIHQSFRLSSIAKSRNESLAVQTRLARQFRDDVHQSTEAEIDPEGSLHLKTEPNGLITYRFETTPNCAVIRVSDSSQAVKERREIFFLGATCVVQFEQSTEPERILLSIDSFAPEDPTIRRTETRITASVDRLRKLERLSGGTP